MFTNSSAIYKNQYLYIGWQRNMLISWISAKRYFPFFQAQESKLAAPKPSNMNVAKHFIRIFMSILALEMSNRDIYFIFFILFSPTSIWLWLLVVLKIWDFPHNQVIHKIFLLSCMHYVRRDAYGTWEGSVWNEGWLEGRCLWFPIKVDLLVHFPSHWLTMANKTAIPACFQGMMQSWTGLGDPSRPKIMTQEYRNLKFLGIQITRVVLGGSHSKDFFHGNFSHGAGSMRAQTQI